MKTHLLLGVSVAALAVAAFMYIKKKGAVDVGVGVVEVAADAGAGVVIGIGDQLGIPRTNQTECERALAEGRTWDASFACPAGTFIKEGIPQAITKPGEALGGWLYDLTH